MKRSRNLVLRTGLTVVLSLLAISAIARAQIPMSYPVSETPLLFGTNPLLPEPEPRLEIPVGMRDLLVESLQAGEVDLRYQAALSIERAHRDGYRDMSDTVEPLLAALSTEPQPFSVRVQIARALVAMDAASAADSLAKIVGQNRQFDMTAEPALARWKYEPMAGIWRARLQDVNLPAYRRKLAIECLGIIGDAESATPLLALATSERDAIMRLAAAESAALLQAAELEVTARDLARRTDGPADSVAARLDQLVAVKLLNGLTSAASQELLLELSSSPHDTVAALSWQRLLEISPGRLTDRVAVGLTHRDPRVRSVAVDIIRQFPDALRVRLLGALLDDREPRVRKAARLTLLDPAIQGPAATGSLAEVADETVAKVFESASWRGLEQAAFYAGSIPDRPMAEPLIPLIRHPRREVAVVSAWALRCLAVPETLPALFESAKEIDKQIRAAPDPYHREGVLAHLFETFGVLKYEPADALLRTWIPKAEPQYSLFYARAAAIDALGRIHAGNGNPGLASWLLGRLTDPGTMPPESDSAFYTSAIALGRIQCRGIIDQLQALPPRGGRAELAVSWALREMTGSPLFDLKPLVRNGTDWLLKPIPKSGTAPAVTAP